MTLLRTTQLDKSFGGLHAVRNIQFELPAGEVRAVIGPNGAGKTTFVSLLSGRLRADSGTVEFDSLDISRYPAWKRARIGIAYTFQVTSIYPRLTVIDNIRIAARFGINRNSADATGQAERCLKTVGLTDQAHKTAGEIAYGHQRLLEIGMGLALKPRLLILDEPTQGLADDDISRFQALVASIRQETTILLIEHNMDVVMSLADRITVLNQGAILAEDTPENIQANRAVQEAYLGT